MSRLHQSTCRSEHVSRTSNLYPDTVSVSIEGSLVRLNTSLLSSPNPRIQVRYRKGPRDTPCRTVCAIVLHRKTKTNTNSNPDPNRYRRRCPDPNARIDYRSLYITWQQRPFAIAGYHQPMNLRKYRTFGLSSSIQVARPAYMLTAHRRHNYYSFMSRSTCIPLYPATDGRQTGDNFVVDTRNMLTATSGYNLYLATCVLV